MPRASYRYALLSLSRTMPKRQVGHSNPSFASLAYLERSSGPNLWNAKNEPRVLHGTERSYMAPQSRVDYIGHTISPNRAVNFMFSR